MTANATQNDLPGPGFLALTLIILLIIGSAFGEGAQEIVLALLLIIMLILLLEGYGQIHDLITGILKGQPQAWVKPNG